MTYTDQILTARPWMSEEALPLDQVRDLLTVNVNTSPVWRETGEYEFLELANGELRIVPVLHQIDKKKAVYDGSTGHDFNVVGKGWVHHDFNEWLVDHVATLVDTGAGDLSIRGVATLDNKAQAVVQIAPPEGITVAGDTVYPYIGAFSSLDSSWATGYKFNAFRIWCRNTARASYRDKSTPMYKVKHTANSSYRVGEARKVIGLFFESIPGLTADIEQLMNAPLPDNQFQMVLNQLFPVPNEEGRGRTIAENKRAQLHTLWKHDDRVAPFTGTAWGAVQAVNTATTHLFTVKGADRFERQLSNTVDGTLDKLDADTITAINKVYKDMGRAPVLT